MAQNHHALVFGASGSAGWAVVDELLKGYSGSFASVTALVNRPLTLEAAGWKAESNVKLQIASGVDLTSGNAEAVASKLEEKVDKLADTTHVFYAAFKQEDVPEDEYRVNESMVSSLLGAMNLKCPKLDTVVFCAGVRYYQRQCSGEKVLPTPFREEMTTWADEETRNGVFYYAWEKALAVVNEGKRWGWSMVLPDAIIGFAPSGSTFALPIWWATWLSTYALKEGKGSEVAFPGTEVSYKTKFNESSAAKIAHQMIWQALKRDKTGSGELFNVADSATPSSMEELWPQLTSYFGLKGTKPPADLNDVTMPSTYVGEHGHLLKEAGFEKANIFKAEWLDVYGTMYTYDRNISLDKISNAGFVEERNPLKGWYEVWDRMKAAKMIPS